MIQTPVLIVGAGPVGLSLALQLDRFGVESIVVERQQSTTSHPKARGLSARTMEQFRVWGLEERVRAGGLAPELQGDSTAAAWVQYYCESGVGRMIGVTRPEVSMYSPGPKCSVAQDVVEEVLSDAVVSQRDAALRRATNLVDFEQVDDAVVARLRDINGDAETHIRADFLVACDGANSGVRDALGIEMGGPGLLDLMASYYYRADLSHLPHARRIAAFSVFPADSSVPPGVILATDNAASRWVYLQRLEAEDEALLNESELARVAQGHWGIPDLDIKLINVMPWRMRAGVPDRYRVGRVFLAGDAAHWIPPTGGLGLNTGFQDAQNLAWKLAMVLKGHAADSLLDTYFDERHPVAERVVTWSVGNHSRLSSFGPALRDRHADPEQWRRVLLDLDNHTHAEGQAMGYTYASRAVIDDGSPCPTHDSRYYWPSDRPGARFPHMWLDTECTRSTIDWFDTSFVLVCAPAAHRWRNAGETIARTAAVPLDVRSLPWLAGPFEMADDAAVLVRPDGHVAWRTDESLDPVGSLRAALDHVLCRDPDGR